MAKFEEIIGYSAVKKELIQIADTLKNREPYDRLGVTAPKGLLLHGDPGVGKTLMASAVIEESGRQTFLCRKDTPNGDFVKKIKETFGRAIENTPSIVFLDDMDKYANGDEDHPDAEEYVTVQACIDEVKGGDVFVLATANNIHSLPPSLHRAGRFDRIIEIAPPHGEDAIDIITHYLRTKKFVADIDARTIARMMEGHSCAELETLVNEAGLYAGYERAASITMEHILKAYMRTVHEVPAFPDDADEAVDACALLADPNHLLSQIIYHEAGHVVVSEVLCPESVTLVSAHNRGDSSRGFTGYYKDDSYTPLYWEKSRIAAALGGIAAIEQKFGIFDAGGVEDLNTVFQRTYDLVVDTCVCGLHLHGNGYHYEDSARLLAEQEQVVSAVVEHFYRKAKEIIARNHDFFEKVATSLAMRRLLSAAGIQQLKSECEIVPIAL